MDECEICGEHERSVREMLEAYPRTTLASSSSSFPFHVFLPLLSPILRLSRRLYTLTYGLLLKDVKCFKFSLTKTTEKIHQVVSFICDRCPLLLWQQCVYFWLVDSFSKELQDLERLRLKRTEEPRVIIWFIWWIISALGVTWLPEESVRGVWVNFFPSLFFSFFRKEQFIEEPTIRI